MKQVIVMRTDLNMRKGKMAAQAAHAAVTAILRLNVRDEILKIVFQQETPMIGFMIVPECGIWLRDGMKKIVVGVGSAEELKALVVKGEAAELPVYTVTDAGLTEFNEPTLTCAAFGPAEDEKIDAITGELLLL